MDVSQKMVKDGGLAEKYRPKTLKDVMGNDNAVRTLKQWAARWKEIAPIWKGWDSMDHKSEIFKDHYEGSGPRKKKID